MSSCTKAVNITKINNFAQESVIEEIAEETMLHIYVNKKFYATLMCTPSDTIELAVGFLFSEGIITSAESIKSLENKGGNTICIILDHEIQDDFEKRKALTSGCVGGSIDLGLFERNNIKPVKSDCKYRCDEILLMMKEFNNKSLIFKQTGGVHSCSICSREGIILFSEDIGRHNAVDKILGRALLNNINLKDKLIMTTGRISSEIVIKAARTGIPIVVSHSAPTDMALTFARLAKITMIGFARGNRMNVYCGEHRIDF